MVLLENSFLYILFLISIEVNIPLVIHGLVATCFSFLVDFRNGACLFGTLVNLFINSLLTS